MTDYPMSTSPTDGYFFKVGKLWRAFQANRKKSAERQKLGEPLRNLNSNQLRDIGFVRDEILDNVNSGNTSCPSIGRGNTIDMTF
ncbi:hypothetical protein [Sulfitobacter aestuariivivens]|uniref:DUF1127 domain-containing protein n=1 Tax=Sulfitobacter aestuariivivens TaxID=2766981 RepID=A0A927HE90_9RHOB|nr:hypothetical protein [Sulfitobacter aestuariivivens]MBD3664522.1 hypothetical protein [Sulfitobacter aestuariivivens]